MEMAETRERGSEVGAILNSVVVFSLMVALECPGYLVVCSRC